MSKEDLKKYRDDYMYLIRHKEFRNYYAGVPKQKDKHFHMVATKDEATRLEKKEAINLLKKKAHPENYELVKVKVVEV